MFASANPNLRVVGHFSGPVEAGAPPAFGFFVSVPALLLAGRALSGSLLSPRRLPPRVRIPFARYLEGPGIRARVRPNRGNGAPAGMLPLERRSVRKPDHSDRLR